VNGRATDPADADVQPRAARHAAQSHSRHSSGGAGASARPCPRWSSSWPTRRRQPPARVDPLQFNGAAPTSASTRDAIEGLAGGHGAPLSPACRCRGTLTTNEQVRRHRARRARGGRAHLRAVLHQGRQGARAWDCDGARHRAVQWRVSSRPAAAI
jgi:hypothetical protein